MTAYKPGVFEEDLQYIYDNATAVFSALKGQRLFITGGTGFFGKWLLESLLWANSNKGLNIEICVLTRSIDKFSQEHPRFATAPSLSFIEGDIRDFSFPNSQFSHIIHAATEASVSLNQEQPEVMFDVTTQGTRRVLEFAEQCGCQRFLLTSSGAVYGKQPAAMTHVKEDHNGAPDPLSPTSAYGEGKRVSEWLCATKNQTSDLQAVVARCFAFVGPFLPLDGAFAVGNFINDGLNDETIVVKGDGTPMRSYLYSADLVVWLLTLLVKGQPGEAYNVGSDIDLSIAELAERTSQAFENCEFKVVSQAEPGALPQRYVPDVSKAKKNFGLTVGIDFDEALKRTIAWHQSYPRRSGTL